MRIIITIIVSFLSAINLIIWALEGNVPAALGWFVATLYSMMLTVELS